MLESDCEVTTRQLQIDTDNRNISSALQQLHGQAIFLLPSGNVEDWQVELTDAVESGRYLFPRAEVDGCDADEIATWLDRILPQSSIRHDTRNALLSDVLSLIELQRSITGADRHRVRILAEKPSCRCGFHVDTVAPGAPTWGLLRVYNGEGTRWVDSRNVVSMSAFYNWLQHRDHIVRDCEPTDPSLADIDRNLLFLHDQADIRDIPKGATVVFRHLDVSLHWTDHSPDLAWIHSSPMSGVPRLVVNVSAAR